MDNSSSAEIEIFLKKQTFQMWQRYSKVRFFKYPLEHVLSCVTKLLELHGRTT